MEKIAQTSNNYMEKAKTILRKCIPSLKWIMILSISVSVGAMISLPVTTWYFNHNIEEGSLSDNFSTESTDHECNAVGINLHGFLDTYISQNGSGMVGDSVASEDVVQQIKNVNEESDIKAVIIEVDSAGGLPIAGEEISNAIKNSKKPVIAFIRGTGVSSAYWAVSSADKIFASKNSDVGSIGITLSYLSNVEKNRKDGYKYEEISSGRYKDTGSPDKVLTEEEKLMLQKNVNTMYSNFVVAISENRKIPIEKVRSFSDGSSVLGEEAIKIGLIDEIGGIDEVEKYLEGLVGEKIYTCW